MKSQTKSNLRVLTECSIMVALTSVLSIIKLLELPYGGSVTVASMLPIVIAAQRHGTKAGIGAALAAAVIQLLLGLNNLSYFTTWYSVVAIILLDYIVAFTVFGLSGIFRNKFSSQASSMFTGALIASVLRYVCHVISGATLWAGLSIPTGAALLYSLGYNATYMIPESVVLLLAVFYIGSSLDFKRDIPTPIAREKLNTGATVLTILSGAVLLCALAADTVLVFSKLQDADSGDFKITGLSSVNWTAVAIISVAAALVFAVLLFIARKLQGKRA